MNSSNPSHTRFGSSLVSFLAFIALSPMLHGQSYQTIPSTAAFNYKIGDPQPSSKLVIFIRTPVTSPFTVYPLTPSHSWILHSGAGGIPVTPTDLGYSQTDFSVIVNPLGLQPGTYNGTIRIASNPSGTNILYTLPVTLNVSSGQPQPTLSVSPAAVSYSSFFGGATTPPQTITVSGTQPGGGEILPTISYSATSNQPFVDLPGSFQSFSSGGSSNFPIAFKPGTLQPGTYTAIVTVSASNGLTKTLSLTGTVTPNLTYSVQLSSDGYIEFTLPPGGSDSRAFDFSYKGNPILIFEPSQSSSWLSLTTNPSPKDNFKLTVAVSAANQSPGQLLGSVRVSASGPISPPAPITFPVRLTIKPPDDLTLSTYSLSFSATAGSASSTPGSIPVTVTNAGAAVPLYAIVSSASWLKVSKSSGSLAANGSDTFTVSADATSLTTSTTGTVTVSAPGRPTRVVNVNLQVTPPVPTDLTVSTSNLSFSATAGSASSTPGSQPITVTNVGAAVPLYAIASSASWLKVSKSSGSLAANGSDAFTVSADATSLTTSTTGTVTVSAPGRPTRVVNVTLQVTPPAATDLTLSTYSLTFSANAGSASAIPGPQSIIISNTGPSVPYTVTSSDSWLQVSPAFGTLPLNGSDFFSVSADATSLTSSRTGIVTVSATGRPTRTVTVNIQVNSFTTTDLTASPSQLTFYADPGQSPPSQTVYLASAGNKTQQVNVFPSSSGSWLQLNSFAFQAPGVIGVTAAPTNVARPSIGQISVVPSASSVPTVNIPITLQAIGAPLYSIPRVADGNFFATTITIVNLDSVDATVSLSFFREDGQGGTKPWLPAMLNSPPLNNYSIPPGASATWQTQGFGAIGENGWALVTCNQRISGFAVFRQTKPGEKPQEAAVPINSGWQQRFLLPFDNLQNTTAVALSNVSPTESSSVTAVFRDEQGELISGSYQRTLPPLGHIAFALAAEDRAHLGARRGTAEFFASGGRLSAAGLRFSDALAITSFEPQSLNSMSSGALIIPQVADGIFPDNSASYTTAITVVNNDIFAARVSLRFYSQNLPNTTTNPWFPAMQNAAPLENVEIKPGSSFTWRTPGAGPLTVGWAEVLSAQRVSGFAIFQQRAAGRPNQEAAVPVNAGPQQRFILPFDNTGNFATTMALANFSATESTVISVAFRDTNNTILRTGQIVLPPRGHNAFPLSDLYPELKSRAGVGEFTASSGQVSALGLRFSENAFTSFRPQVK